MGRRGIKGMKLKENQLHALQEGITVPGAIQVLSWLQELESWEEWKERWEGPLQVPLYNSEIYQAPEVYKKYSISEKNTVLVRKIKY